MNLLDIVLLAALLFAGVRGWREGALSQVLAFGGAALGLVLGASYAPAVAGSFIDQPGLQLALVTLGLLLAAVALVQGVGFAVGLRLQRAVHHAGAGALDRVAGVGVGLVSVVVTVWLAASVLVQGPTPFVAQALRGSLVVQTIDRVLPPAPDIFGRVATYLDRQGFPPVFAGLGGPTGPPVDAPQEGAVAAAAAAGQPGTVQVESLGCGGVSSGTGFAVQQGFIVTNAHVVAGGDVVMVRDASGTHDAVPVHVDARLDLAVLSSPASTATPLAWTAEAAVRGTSGAVLGFPGGQRTLAVRPAAVRSRTNAVGRDIYGRGVSAREVLILSADVLRGDSGGPFMTAAGTVGGVIFAASSSEPGVGYALTAEQVRSDVDTAIARNSAVPTGSCRY